MKAATTAESSKENNLSIIKLQRTDPVEEEEERFSWGFQQPPQKAMLVNQEIERMS